MKGDQQVIDQFNKLLTGEMTSADQYFLQSRMFENWGLEKLHERCKHEMEDELGHASTLIERILFLEGEPNVAARAALKIGKTVPTMLTNNLEMELGVVSALREAIVVCESHHDYQSREILETLLKDTEEDHTLWLETQLGLIEKTGLENYVQSQM